MIPLSKCGFFAEDTLLESGAGHFCELNRKNDLALTTQLEPKDYRIPDELCF